MRMTATTILLAFLVAGSPGAAFADPRSEWPSPSMSNADLRKSCSGEASRVHRRGRGFRTDAAYMAQLRRDYRKECVARVKRLRKTAVVLEPAGRSGAQAGRA
jgi:hypothetical protein